MAGNAQYICVTSGFRREADDICALMCYCAAYNGNSLSTFRDNPPVLCTK